MTPADENSTKAATRGRPFPAGVSGNPGGRPPGPNSLTRAARERIAQECDPLGFLTGVMRGEPQKYGEGDDAGAHQPSMADRMNAARTLANKLAPDAKDRPLSFPVGAIDGPSDALKVMGKILEAMSIGDLTASESAGAMTVVSSYLEAWKANDLERRMRILEEQGDKR